MFFLQNESHFRRPFFYICLENFDEMMEKSGLANLVRQTIVQPVIVHNLPEHAADEERVNQLIEDHHHARLFTELQEFS